jgi:hypothetical protein
MLEDLDDEGIGTMMEDGITPTEEEYGMIVEEHPKANDEEALDKYLNMELRMGTGTDDERWRWVIKCAKGIGGEPVGHAHANPFFDTREYEVKFTDGTIEQYATNFIAKNMYPQVNDEGNVFQLLDEIMDHKKDDTAIDIANGTVTTSSGNVKPKITTQGWQFFVLWKDKSMSWVNLKDLKASNPVELAEYAVANWIAEEPAFKLWVTNTLHKWNHIISKVKKKYWWMTHKFGCKLPHSVEEALEINRQTRTDHWQTALNKEMSKVKVAWNAHDDITPNDIQSEGKVKDMIGFQEIGWLPHCFDIKMDFTRKARFCAGRHTTNTPAAMTYSSVFSKEQCLNWVYACSTQWIGRDGL